MTVAKKLVIHFVIFLKKCCKEKLIYVDFITLN